ncbi:MAG TPA: hypothetical protein VHT27_14040 [Solirubrobacteraceae bacterium]|nr:hypothetical protein [Solirubrobacteraceae bacterium]
MEIGGFFILLLVLIVLAVLGGGVYAIAAGLRNRQLHPERDKVEGRRDAPERPEHVAVENEQHSRYVGTRR